MDNGIRTGLDETYEYAVLGSGYASFSAAATLARSGHRTILVASRGDMVWESGRCFAVTSGESGDPLWRELRSRVARLGGVSGQWQDGALSEVAATELLTGLDCAILYYARPIAARRTPDDREIASVDFAMAMGVQTIAARSWVDGTETGELLRLVNPGARPRSPERYTVTVALQHPDWSGVAHTDELVPTSWPSERLLTVDSNHREPLWRESVLEALTRLERDIGVEMSKVCASHLSFEPLPSYGPGTTSTETPENLHLATPSHMTRAVVTLADRLSLGTAAARAALAAQLTRSTAMSWPSVKRAELSISKDVEVDVCVLGAGTGGTLAAIAAARNGANVVCVEPMPFAGGVGTGGGIHAYWFGVPGGLQAELDSRTHALMKQFGGGPFGDGPFNPWAKMIAIDRMLHDEGIGVLTDGMYFDAETDDGRVVAVHVATPEGVVRIRARVFIDATPNADLCAAAGCDFQSGREHDGLLHAYSQSSGRLRTLRGNPRMDNVNFDAGYCEAADPLDVTRARLDGVLDYAVSSSYTDTTRPTYIAPILGLRQGRQIVTDYMLTLDDLIARRRFPDSIGYTSAHIDNHATDYEFESDEAVFFLWANRQFNVPVASHMAYRMLIPRGVRNVLIGGRCLGVTQDAHYVARMQRDIQRVGEAAGYAAALAIRDGVDVRDVPYPRLRELLERSNALSITPRTLETGFGLFAFLDADGEPQEDARPSSAHALFDEIEERRFAIDLTVADATRALDTGTAGAPIWWIYRSPQHMRDIVVNRLQHSADHSPMTTWLAAAVAAMWGEPSAEPRLLSALREREYGFASAVSDRSTSGVAGSEGGPLEWNKVVPHWLCAIALLRRCGSPSMLIELERILQSPVHGINTLTSIALTISSCAARGVFSDPADSVRATGILDRILTARTIGSLDRPSRYVGKYSESALRHQDAVGDFASSIDLEAPLDEQLRNTYTDNTWQLHLAVAKAHLQLSGAPHAEALGYAEDPRGYVRRAFRELARISVPVAP